MNGNAFEPMGDERTDREIRRFLEWDTEGISGAPTRAEMIVRLERATRARVARPGAFQWTPTLRIAVLLGLLSALVAGAFAAGALWNRQSLIVSIPSPTIGPTARPMAGQRLDAGTWYVDIETVRIRFIIPDGWEHGRFGHLNWLTPSANGAAHLLATTVTNVVETPCGPSRSPAVGPSVDNLVTALTDLSGLEPSSPVDATVDGYRGKQFTLLAPETLEGCIGTIDVWSNFGGARSYLDFGEATSIWVLDVAGTRLLVRTMVLPDTTPQERAATQQIFDSIQFEPLPASTTPLATQ